MNANIGLSVETSQGSAENETSGGSIKLRRVDENLSLL